jgi:hypothetical protein
MVWKPKRFHHPPPFDGGACHNRHVGIASTSELVAKILATISAPIGDLLDPQRSYFSVAMIRLLRPINGCRHGELSLRFQLEAIGESWSAWLGVMSMSLSTSTGNFRIGVYGAIEGGLVGSLLVVVDGVLWR